MIEVETPEIRPKPDATYQAERVVEWAHDDQAWPDAPDRRVRARRRFHEHHVDIPRVHDPVEQPLVRVAGDDSGCPESGRCRHRGVDASRIDEHHWGSPLLIAIHLCARIRSSHRSAPAPEEIWFREWMSSNGSAR